MTVFPAEPPTRNSINQQIHNLGTHKFDLGKPQMRFLLTMPSGNEEISPDTTECLSVLERQHLPSPNPDLSNKTQNPKQYEKVYTMKGEYNHINKGVCGENLSHYREVSIFCLQQRQ
jgi:hypothetical protein